MNGYIWNMDMYRICTEVSPSFPEDLDADNSISELISFNNLLYNLCSFIWKSVL